MKNLLKIVVSWLCFLYALGATSPNNAPDATATTCDQTMHPGSQVSCNLNLSENKIQTIHNTSHSNHTSHLIMPNVSHNCAANLEYLMTHHPSFLQQYHNVIDNLEVHLGRLKDVWPESFEACLNVRTSDQLIHGRYCLVYFLSPTMEKMTDDEIDILERRIEPMRYPYPILQSGVCIPDSCSTTDLQELLKHYLKDDAYKYTVFVPQDFCQTDEVKPMPLGTKIVGAGIIIIASMAVFGTILEVLEYKRKAHSLSKTEKAKPNTLPMQHEANIVRSVAKCFSLFSNSWYLFKMDVVNPGEIDTFNGAKFYATVACLMMHLTLIGNFNAWNDIDEHPWLKSASIHGFFHMQIMLQAMVAISGAGIAMSTLHRMQVKHKRLNIISFFFRRIWRMSPPYYIIIALFAYVVPYLGSGPKWPEIQYEAEICKNTWWTNILYINNYINDPICLFHTWYLSADMQLLFIALLLIVAFNRSARLGVSLVAMFITYSVTKLFYQAYFHSMNPLYMGTDPTITKGRLYFRNLYFLPFSRIGCYCIGVTLGYLIHTYGKSVTIKKSVHRWASPIATILIFSPAFHWYRYASNTYPHPTYLEAALYESFSRLFFTIPASYLCFSIYAGYQDAATRVLRSILCQKFFVFTSKLNYAFYLLHLIVIKYFLSSLPQPMEFSTLRFFKISFGLVIVTYLLAIPFTLLTVFPFARLERILEERLKTNKPAKEIKQS